MQDRELMQRFLANVDVLCGYAARAAEGADIDWGGVDGDIGVDIRRDMTAFRILLKQLLYTASPQREWQGLTDEEISELYWQNGASKFVRAIEAKLKEKNT